IGARNQQHEGDCSHEDEKRFPNLADEQILERKNLGGHLGPMLAWPDWQLRNQAFQFRLRLLLRNGSPQSPEGGPEIGVPRVASDRQRQPQFSVARKREPSPHDANYTALDSVYRDGLFQDVRIRSKTAAPKFIAEHNDTGGAGLLFLGAERSSHRRTD